MNSIRKGNMPITAIVDNLPFFSAAFEDLFITKLACKKSPDAFK